MGKMKMKGPRAAGVSKAKGGPLKKWKGKKKVRNLEEKKAKGLHLNKVDRKKIVKLQEKKTLQEKIDKKVKADLEQLEENSVSSLSESSFGSQPLPKKKRVSFAQALEHRKVFDKNEKNLKVKASEASPGKSILKEKKARKAALKKAAAVKKERKVKVEISSEPVNEEDMMEVDKKENEDTYENMEEDGHTKTVDESSIAKEKLKVPRAIKAQLLAMPRKERKKFLRELKAKKKPQTERSFECKKLWEKIRSSLTHNKVKTESVDELWNLVKGHAKELIYAHDTARVIQCLLVQKRKDIRDALFDELHPELVRMTKSIYARVYVMRMLKKGTPEQREQIFNAFRGHCVSLFKVRWAAEVLDLAYNDYARLQQRFDIVSEFYGKEFVLFRANTARSLHKIIEEEPSKKAGIVKHLEDIVMDVASKTTLKLSLTHRLMADFLSFADREQKENLIETIKDKIPEIVHTMDGVRVTWMCLWNAAAKDRKMMVKNFKDLALKAATDEYGYRALMGVFDTVDDTVLVNKHITQELANYIGKVVTDRFGVRLIHYIVHPRDGRVLDVQTISELQKGDQNEYSKKLKAERYNEIYTCIYEPLFTYLAANMGDLIHTKQTSTLILDCLEPLREEYEHFPRWVNKKERNECYKAIAELGKEEFIPGDPDSRHIIESQHASFTISRILYGDDKLPEEDRLSTHLSLLPEECLESWVACNRGCFILLRMFEKGGIAVQKKLKSCLSMKRLQAYSNTGAKHLYQAILSSASVKKEEAI